MACQPGDKDKTTGVEQKPAAAVTDSVKDENKIGYALGAKMATFIRTDIDKYKLPNLDKEAIAKGFNDGLKNQSKMEEAEIAEQFAKFQQIIQAAQQQEQAVQKEKNDEAAKGTIAAGDAFLAENGKKEGVITTESGIQYTVIKAGEKGGAKPTAEDTVKVHYHGSLIDGKVFDSSVDRGEPVSFPLNRVIPGWTEGVQLMSVGSKYHFVIPWALAYGAQGRPGTIPGHSVLQFDVELLEINPKPEAPVVKPAEKPKEEAKK